jgi:Tol biopolymer transport system component
MEIHARRLAAVCLIVLFASPVSAQYFGRNKVRYRSFDFQVMTTEHFDIYFYPSEREGVDIAARLAERWYTRLERVFGRGLSGRQPLVLYASHADFEQTNIIAGELGEGTGGVTEPLRRRVVLPLAGPIGDTDHVIGHELVHAFQFDLAMLPGGQVGQTPLARLPLWFVEGMAEYLSLGSVDAHAAMKVRDAAARNALPSIRDLSAPKYFPYQWGHAVFAYIASRYGETAVPRLFSTALAYGSVEDAIKTSLGVTAQELSNDWHAAIRRLSGPILSASVPLSKAGRPDGQRPDTAVNVGPALSPDGEWMAFLSARSLFSIDLYVAKAKTGQIVRRLTRTATDPHYTSIQFINSSAAWDPSNTRVAVGTIARGQAVLAIFNARNGKREREIVVSGIDEIWTPAWAPDGHAIAFTGMRGGLTDLYVYDFRDGMVRPLTSDAYADLQPAWSPDGRRVAFATDRFSSELDSLRMGPLRLAITDAAGTSLEPVPVFDRGKHINPQWSTDGLSVYFIADPDGVPNVYRVSLAGREVTQITAVQIGVSGITPSSPALSLSARGDRLAITTYENERYRIDLRSATESVGSPRSLPVHAAALAPTDRTGLLRLVTFSEVEVRPPDAQAYPTARYEPKMSLLAEGESAAAIGVGSFGAAAGGGAGFAFSDMLGDRLLTTAAQVGTPLTGTLNVNDVAFQTGYLRQDRRWTWGFLGGQIPYVIAAFAGAPAAEASGNGVEIDRQAVVRETQRRSTGILMYPFDRARRLELAGGVAQIVREEIVTSFVYSEAIDDIRANAVTRPLGERLDLATSAAALVFDATTFGPISPVQGQRYRLEVAPTFGSINFTGVLADYRRYMMPVPFYTIAARFIHYGRYGAGADDLRLHPIYLSDPSLVRGYDGRDRFSDGCTAASEVMCRRDHRYVGSRVFVGNLELRFPLLRPFGVSHGMYGPMPIELAVFADSGAVWSSRGTPSLPEVVRRGITSTGLAVRLGLGFAAAEFDVVRPFQRGENGWTFGFNLIPGW